MTQNLDAHVAPGPGISSTIPRPRSLHRLSPTMGAEISGIDLAMPLSDAVMVDIQTAFLEHHLLVFRRQALDADQIQRFAERFGPIEGHIVQRPDGAVLSGVHAVTNLDADGNPSKKPHINANYYWHSDKSYYPTPALLTMLYSVELPPNGGETEFANMQMAYEALPDMTKRSIDGLQVENDFEYAMTNAGKALNEAEVRAAPPVVHPLVPRHPETGRKSLFVGMYSKNVIGMPEAEGRALIKSLLDHASGPEFTFSHRWQVGDLMLWDNRCLNHRAVANYEMAAFRRVLLRCVVKGKLAS